MRGNDSTRWRIWGKVLIALRRAKAKSVSGVLVRTVVCNVFKEGKCCPSWKHTCSQSLADFTCKSTEYLTREGRRSDPIKRPSNIGSFGPWMTKRKSVKAGRSSIGYVVVKSNFPKYWKRNVKCRRFLSPSTLWRTKFRFQSVASDVSKANVMEVMECLGMNFASMFLVCSVRSTGMEPFFTRTFTRYSSQSSSSTKQPFAISHARRRVCSLGNRAGYEMMGGRVSAIYVIESSSHRR